MIHASNDKITFSSKKVDIHTCTQCKSNHTDGSLNEIQRNNFIKTKLCPSCWFFTMLYGEDK